MKLQEPDQNFCDRPISEKEAKEVVKNMKNNKTPAVRCCFSKETKGLCSKCLLQRCF